MIQKDIDALTREKSNNIKNHNILNILNNVGAVFGSIYFHHKDVPKETMFERTIVERSKLRKGKIIEIEREEKCINNELVKEYFTIYQSPSDMCKKLGETEGIKCENRVYLNKEVLNEMKKVIENVPENKTFSIEENENIIDIVKRILYFNQLNQSGQGLNILKPNQMLGRLPISLAQLKAGNNSVKLKNEIRQLLYSLYQSKNLQNNFIKV